jgi:hypothetical protein
VIRDQELSQNTAIGGDAKPRDSRRTVSLAKNPSSAPARIFLLSPANSAGPRGRLITSDDTAFHLAMRLRSQGLPLGEVFSFISGLYFRGKLAYACAFARVPEGIPGAFVITAGRGLLPPEQRVTLADIREMSEIPVEATDARYRAPLERDAKVVRDYFSDNCEIVLLGSIATPKYVEPLLGIFGERLLFPAEFVGRGDMSRGGLMLRCVRAGIELTHVPVATAVRHGKRPPKLTQPGRRLESPI